MPRGDAPRVLAEFARVLRPGGALYLCTGEGEQEGWEADRYGPQHPRYFVYHRKDDLIALLDAVGFHVIDAEVEFANRPWVSIRALTG